MTTREQLLRHATRLFSQKGYDGAATAAIVRAAKVTQRMLYHYFGSKDGLYRAVLEAQWAGLAEALGAVDLGCGDPVMALVDAAFDFVAAHPEFVRLAMWEGLRGGRTSRGLWGHARG